MPDHPQTHIALGEREADVDESVAPLILELWKADIDTLMSCQDNNGRVWLDFPSAEDAQKFLDIAAGDYEEDVFSLYNRVTVEFTDDDAETFQEQNAWWYDCDPVDYHMRVYDLMSGEIKREAAPTRWIVLHISIRFPKYDLDEVLARMVAHNAGVGSS